MNLAQAKTDVAQIRKSEVVLRLQSLRNEQKNASFLQSISSKITSYQISEQRYRKNNNKLKKNKIKKQLRISRIQRQLERAEKKLQEASEELTIAHQMQTDLLTKMSRGEEVKVDILMVHAQDHLSSAILVNDLAKQLIAMEKEIQELKAVIHGQKEN